MMTKTLAEYYANNYTQCEIDNSFLGSWRGLAYTSHLTQVIAVPIQLFTFYLIIYKTPNNMRCVKTPLLVTHSCCSLLDFSLGTLSTPYVFFPTCSMFGVGVLNLFPIPMIILIILGMLVIFAMAVSLIYLFESRSSSIKDNKYRLESQSSRSIYYLLNYLSHCLLFIFFYNFPESEEIGKLAILDVIPCPTREFFEESVCVLLSDPIVMKIVCFIVLPLLGLLDAGQISFYLGCLIYHLYIAPSGSTSSKTRKLQKHFFIGIVAQSGIPLGIFVVTYVTGGILYLTDNLTQGLVNMSVVIFGVHGIAESLVIILVHSSYRSTIRSFFTRADNKVHTEIGKNFGNPIHSVSSFGGKP
ncbi:unnamed protein product [Caenorhabditis brenneri]